MIQQRQRGAGKQGAGVVRTGKQGTGVVVFPQADVPWNNGSTTTIQGRAEVSRRDGPGGGVVMLLWPGAGHGIPLVPEGGSWQPAPFLSGE